MKTVLRTAGILAIACSAAFTSCAKKSAEASLDILENQKDAEYYESNGSVSAKFSGNLKGKSGYTDQKYAISRTFSFLNDNVDGTPSNRMTTKRYSYTDKTTPANDYDYTVKHFTIHMYAASGESKTDLATRESITISFNYYEGKLTESMLKQEVKVKTPTEITVEYSLAYNPENTIDVLNIDGEIDYTYANLSPYAIKNNIDIVDFKFDTASGDISFTFSGDDSLDTINKEKITEGNVSTTILVNEILDENTNLDY